MEITCTRTQKKKIIDTLEHMDNPCLFPRAQSTCYLNRSASCRDCLEKRITWNITERQKKGAL